MKTIVICVDLTKNCLETLKTLPSKIDLGESRVHFLHIFEKLEPNRILAPFMVPLPEQKMEIEKNVLEALSKLSSELGLNPDYVHLVCSFEYSREQTVKEYLTRINADLVVLATRGRHGIVGFFTSSLADFLCKYSPCDVLVLRPADRLIR